MVQYGKKTSCSRQEMEPCTICEVEVGQIPFAHHLLCHRCRGEYLITTSEAKKRFPGITSADLYRVDHHSFVTRAGYPGCNFWLPAIEGIYPTLPQIVAAKQDKKANDQAREAIAESFRQPRRAAVMKYLENICRDEDLLLRIQMTEAFERFANDITKAQKNVRDGKDPLPTGMAVSRCVGRICGELGIDKIKPVAKAKRGRQN